MLNIVVVQAPLCSVGRAIDSSQIQALLLISDVYLHGSVIELVLSRHVHDLLGLNVESRPDLWHTTRHVWDHIEVELTQEVVVLSPCTFAP